MCCPPAECRQGPQGRHCWPENTEKSTFIFFLGKICIICCLPVTSYPVGCTALSIITVEFLSNYISASLLCDFMKSTQGSCALYQCQWTSVSSNIQSGLDPVTPRPARRSAWEKNVNKACFLRAVSVSYKKNYGCIFFKPTLAEGGEAVWSVWLQIYFPCHFQDGTFAK